MKAPLVRLGRRSLSDPCPTSLNEVSAVVGEEFVQHSNTIHQQTPNHNFTSHRVLRIVVSISTSSPSNTRYVGVPDGLVHRRTRARRAHSVGVDKQPKSDLWLAFDKGRYV